MLEFIIKQNDNEIGRLQFDPSWHTFDVVMNMLGGYVVREFAPGGKVSGGFSNQVKEVAIPGTQLSALEGHTEVTTSPPPSDDPSTPSSTRTEEDSLSDRDYVIFSKRAGGRRHALKFRGKVLNGNMVAGLIALYKREAPIDEPRDLLTALRRDPRFLTGAEKSAVGTIRNFLANLIKEDLVERREDSSYAITELGVKVARLMDIPLEPRQASEGDASE